MRISSFTKLFATVLILLLLTIGAMAFQALNIQDDIVVTQNWTQSKLNEALGHLHRNMLMMVALTVTTLLSVVVAIVYTRRTILLPLAQLHEEAKSIAEGAYQARCDIDTSNELAELGAMFNSMAVTIEKDIATRRALEECMQQATAIFENSSEAVMITDAENIIVSVNPAFTKVTGYRPDEAVGKNWDLLETSMKEQPFFLTVKNSLDTTGRWEGEMTSWRKNREAYVEWRRVNAIYRDGGSIHGWITLFSDITPEKKSEELIWQQTNFDPLTDLPNRHMFHNRLEQEIRKVDRLGSSLALILLDLDNFKEVNDTYGHNSGNVLLKEAAWRLNSCVRGTDTVARMGGDEFTVILAPLKSLISINRVIRDILYKMAMPFQLGDKTAYISASIGVTFYPHDATDPESLVRNAGQAMYAAKNKGRNCFNYFTPTLNEAAQNRMRLASDLRGALADHQFQLYYQPIVELSTSQIHKAEALLRWHHPELGLINPADFVSIAEETRMIVDIGNWVFQKALQQVAAWRVSYFPQFQISINISAVQFGKDVDLFSSWLGSLREMRLPGQSIAIEITESLLMDTTCDVRSRLRGFREAGLQVSLDDFGTGYSSLGYLKKFDIDYLKIDRTFVQNLGPDSEDLALCEAIIVMAHKLGIKVIAEGIETMEQRDLLTLVGCDYGQGNLFSKAVPAKGFENGITEQEEVSDMSLRIKNNNGREDSVRTGSSRVLLPYNNITQPSVFTA